MILPFSIGLRLAVALGLAFPALSWSQAANAGGALSPMGSPPNWQLLREFSGSMTRQEFDHALKEIYLEASPYPVPWIATPDGVKIQTGRDDMPQVEVSFVRKGTQPSAPPRYWRRPADLPPMRDRLPLSDVHIAIDPGHIGGSFGAMEERRLSFGPGELVQEGDLTLLTARVLAPRLQALGAKVTLVRSTNQPVTKETPETLREVARQSLIESGIAEPLDDAAGLSIDQKPLTVRWQSERLFYRSAEIQARARLVNEEIRPDLVLCLHFNADPWGDPANPQFTSGSHLHLLVNGCYSPNEIAQQDTRFELLRRLFSRVHEEEIALAEALAPAMARRTGLPPFQYTTPNARPIGQGEYVYARNLLANRVYQCPVVFFEPFVMNHELTYYRLLAGHWVGRTLIQGELLTSPIEDYVRGIIDGLVTYFQSKRHS